MMNGTDQLAVINQHIATARDGLDTIYQRMETANQGLIRLRNQLAEEYRQLARFRLDELAANQVGTQLDETDRAVLKLLERRSQAMRELDSAIEQSIARLGPLNAEREQAVRKRDDLVKQIDDSAAEVKLQLSRQEAYQEQEKRVAETAARAEGAENKAAQAEADQEEKGRPYREDPLFMYLWKRRFLTPDYTGGGLNPRSGRLGSKDDQVCGCPQQLLHADGTAGAVARARRTAEGDRGRGASEAARHGSQSPCRKRTKKKSWNAKRA